MSNRVQNGKVTVVNVKVTNLGTAKASGYKVHLYVDGKKYETEEGEYLEPNAQATYEFAFTPKLGAKSFKVSGEVEWSADAFQDNNKTDEATVGIVKSPLPAISDLAASAKGVLTWSSMNVDGAVVKDDFETYTPWSINNVGDPAAGIGLVTVEGAKADNRVYTVDGQYVGKSLQNLNKGLYIQNGKKVVVK